MFEKDYLEAIAEAIGLNVKEIEQRKAYLEFNAEDIQYLKELHPLLKKFKSDFVERFYSHLLNFKEAKAFLKNPDVIQRLKKAQADYFDSLTQGDYGWDYVLKRLVIGLVHQRIGLRPVWYIGAYHKYLRELLPEIVRIMSFDFNKVEKCYSALRKILFFDMGLALDTYSYASEKLLSESEKRYQSLVESSYDCICHLDLEGRFLYMSPTGLESHDMTLDEIKGLHCNQLAHPKYKDLMDKTLKKSQEGEVVQFEYESENNKWFEGTLSPIKDNLGKLTGLLRISRDITQKKETDEALRQSEQALRQTQKMDAIGKLAGGIAHDFNTLLTTILGYTGLLNEQMDPKDSKREIADEIKKAAERAVSLTKQLLIFSRRQDMIFQILDLNIIIKNMKKMLEHIIEKNVEIVIHLKPDLSHVKVNLGQIEQVIMNLAINARDAMPKGGKLTFETSMIRPDKNLILKHSELNDEQYVVLTVSDTGAGMNADVLAHLFEPFFSTKEEGKGTGLGLFVVYGSIQKNNGHIFVESEEGKGTSFKIYLPCDGNED